MAAIDRISQMMEHPMSKKRLIPLIGLALALVVAGVVLGFTISGGSGDEEGFTGTQPPIRSDEGINEVECDYVHNFAACDGNPILEEPPLPTYEEWLSDQGTEVFDSYQPVPSDGIPRSTNGKVVTSIDLIDPDLCNAIHNINACTPKELAELGMAPVGGPGPSGENHAVVEPQPDVQLYDEADAKDCDLAGGLVYLSSDGPTGCVFLNDFEAGGTGDIQQQPPAVTPQILPATK